MIKSYELISEKDLYRALSRLSFSRLAIVDVSAKPFEILLDKENERIMKYDTVGKFYYDYLRKKFNLTSKDIAEHHLSPFGMYHFIAHIDSFSHEDVYRYVNGTPHTYYFEEQGKILMTTRHLMEDMLYYGDVDRIMLKYGDVPLSPLEVVEKEVVRFYPDDEKKEYALYDIVNGKITSILPAVYLVYFEYYRDVNNGTLLYVLEHIGRTATHQLVRHQSFGFQERSFRYINVKVSSQKGVFVLPVPKDIMYGDPTAKELYVELVDEAYKLYSLLVGVFDIKPEDARSILPMDVSSTLVVGGLIKRPEEKASTYDGFREFFRKRTSPKAQWQIRAFAHAMEKALDRVMERYGL